MKVFEQGMEKEFVAAVNQICDEKGISEKHVYETIEAAIASAYRKDFGKPGQKIIANFNPKTGNVKLFRVLEVVEEVKNPDAQVILKDAEKFKKKPKLEDTIEIEVSEEGKFGRIAAQTAKQVVVQKIRESEREVLFKEFKGKVSELLTGQVQQIEGRNVIINLGRANGILFPSEQIPNENYYIGQRLKVYVSSVDESGRGPQIILSRTNSEMIKRLFELEVPEINAKSVEIKSIAREAGKRSKVAVIATQEGVDPVGSCVGQRGTRIQSILAEIGDEKIDIILWDEDSEVFIENALSPAKIKNIKLTKKTKKAKVETLEDQLSLAIGKEGQNVRLASTLTGWEIDVEKARIDKKTDAKVVKKDPSTKLKVSKKEKGKKVKTKVSKAKIETKKTKTKTKKVTKTKSSDKKSK